jgi:hypothetical protein
MATGTAVAPAVEKIERLKRKYNDAYNKWCDENHVDVGRAEGFQAWDEKHNFSRYKDLFGSDEAIYAAGLRLLYIQDYHSYNRISVKRSPEEPSVVMRNIRTYYVEDSAGNKEKRALPFCKLTVAAVEAIGVDIKNRIQTFERQLEVLEGTTLAQKKAIWKKYVKSHSKFDD